MQKYAFSLIIVVFLIILGTLPSSGAPLEFVMPSDKLSFGQLAVNDSMPWKMESLTIRVNNHTGWVLRVWRLDGNHDKLIAASQDNKEIGQTPLVLARSSSPLSLNLILKLEPELLAGTRDLQVRFSLEDPDGRTEIARQDIQMTFEIPPVTKLFIQSMMALLKTPPGEEAVQNQVNLSVLATCPWEIRMDLDETDGLTQNPDMLMQWRIDHQSWNRLGKSQVILRGNPTLTRDSLFVVSQGFLFQPGWQITPKNYTLRFAYAIYATQ